jgi:hypothetical protein
MYIKKEATAEDILDLINWLETKTGNYDANDTSDCAIALYLKDRGHKDVRFWGLYEVKADGNNIDMPSVISSIVYGDVRSDINRQSYADALERARIVHVDMLYAVKPSEDPGAENLMIDTIEDNTGEALPEQVDDPNLPLKDDDTTI